MNSSAPVRVLVVDDHPMMRFGIIGVINSCPDMKVVGEAGTGEEALRIFPDCRPDIVLMDLRLPQISGAETIRTLRSRSPKIKVLVLTTYEGDEDIHQALEAGASGYIIKGMSHKVLIDGIRSVRDGRKFIPDPVADILKGRPPHSELTPRELEILALIVAGKSNRQIADTLRITEPTVKGHVSVILERMGVGDRTQAAVAALQRGIVRL